MKTVKCIVDGCPNDATPRTDFCKACSSRNRYWLQKTPLERIERANRLARWSAGMRLLDPNVILVKQRKKRKLKIKTKIRKRKAS